jgi:hypothetical protein
MSLPVKVSGAAAQEILEIQRVFWKKPMWVLVFDSEPIWNVAFRSFSNIPEEREFDIGIIARFQLKHSAFT